MDAKRKAYLDARCPACNHQRGFHVSSDGTTDTSCDVLECGCAGFPVHAGIRCAYAGCGHSMLRHDEQGRCWMTNCIDDNHLPCTTNNNPHAAPVLLSDAAVEALDADPVHHPSHYRPYYPGGPECIDVTGAMGFNVGNAVKYLWRAGRKTPDAVEDLQKALVYVQFEIDRLTKETS